MAARTGRGGIAASLALVLSASAALVAVPGPVLAAFPGANGLIAWQRNDENGSKVWTMHLDGTGRQQLVVGANPSWSPDGSKVAYADGSGISIIGADGSNPTHILDFGIRPKWSPDGSKIVFEAFVSSDYDIYVAGADGSNVTNLTKDLGEDVAPSWSPDGTRIAWQSNRGGQPQVWVMDTDGSDPVNLSGTQYGGDPDWSPDGSKLAFSGAGIWTMHADGTAKTKIAPSGWGSVWTADGTRVLFTDHNPYNDELYSVLANGTGLLRLTNDGSTGTYPEDWFPSSQPVPFALTPSAFAFGTGVVATPTASKTATLKAGDDPITIDGVGITGANAADFAITSNGCAGTIAAYATCSIAVRFTAGAAGPRTASLEVTGPAPLGTASVALTGTGALFLWGTTRTAGPQYTWNLGSSMAATVSGSTQYLHATYTTDRVSGKWVTDTSPRAGVYYERSSNGGATWTTPRRLNPSTQHGSRGSVASSGSYVYATWVSTTKWLKYSGTAPRILYFRRNTNHGSSTAWGSTIRLTSTSGRVDFPTLAASGSYVYVAWTDSATGAIKVAISANRGATWRTVTVGSTSSTNSSGRLGIPVVAATGNTVAVAWVSDADWVIKARVSTDKGATWGTTATFTGSSTRPSIAASGDRVGVAWSADTIQVRVSKAGVWGSQLALPATDGVAVEEQWGPTVALLAPASVGVAYSSCVADCTSSDAGVITRTNLIWRQSIDDGATWAPSDVVASSTATAARRQNDSASIVWRTTKRPYLLFNGWTEDTNYYRLSLRAGA